MPQLPLCSHAMHSGASGMQREHKGEALAHLKGSSASKVTTHGDMLVACASTCFLTTPAEALSCFSCSETRRLHGVILQVEKLRQGLYGERRDQGSVKTSAVTG